MLLAIYGVCVDCIMVLVQSLFDYIVGGIFAIKVLLQYNYMYTVSISDILILIPHCELKNVCHNASTHPIVNPFATKFRPA